MARRLEMRQGCLISLESKVDSLTWKQPGFTIAKKFKILNIEKVMATTFWDIHGTIFGVYFLQYNSCLSNHPE